MTIATTSTAHAQRTHTPKVKAAAAFLPSAIAAAGAAAVIAGSYSTWATFYAGLITRDGVAGHGKYFIGLAAAALLAVALSSLRGVWPGMRLLATAAGVTIAAVALRDLRNLDALVQDPAAAFYVPGKGHGLSVVFFGGSLLALAPLARPFAPAARMSWTRTALAAAFVAAVAMLVPGLYGQYYLHVSDGHAHGHADALQPAHILTAAGSLTLLAACHAAVVRGTRARAGSGS